VALVKADRRVGLLAAKVDRRSTAQSPVLEPAPAVAATREARCQKHSSIRYDAIQYATFCALKKRRIVSLVYCTKSEQKIKENREKQAVRVATRYAPAPLLRLWAP